MQKGSSKHHCMNILITGAAGRVGKSLGRYLNKAGYKVVAVDIVKQDGVVAADLQDEAVAFELVRTYAPDLILHLAALTNLQFCEENKAASHAANYAMTEVLVKVCSAFGTAMVFFSSDYVFGKYDKFWRENDPVCPKTQYGRDKAAAESLIQRSLSDYAIIRTAQLYGFAGDFVSLVRRTLTSQQKFTAFANLVNCPTWTGDLFPMLNKIIMEKHQGIFHCVGPEAMSRYAYACAVAEVFALDIASVEPVYLDFAKAMYPPVVRLDGASTYKKLGIYPSKLKDNLKLWSECYV